MRSPLWPLIFLIIALQSTRLAAAQYPVLGLFDAEGVPTEEMENLFSSGGRLLRKPIAGLDVPLIILDKDGRWAPLSDPGCVIVGFHVTDDGAVDAFRLLDARPKNLVTSAILTAMTTWKFEKAETLTAFVLPVSFEALDIGTSSQMALFDRPGSRFRRTTDCLMPSQTRQVSLPQSVEYSTSPMAPILPKADLLREHKSGCVTIAFRIGQDGSPSDLELLDSKPGQAFVEVAVAQIDVWRFKRSGADSSSAPEFGFVQFGYGEKGKEAEIAQCMTSSFAAEHYQPSEQTP